MKNLSGFLTIGGKGKKIQKSKKFLKDLLDAKMFLFALKKGEKRGIFDQEGKFKKRVRRKNKMGPEKKQNGTGEKKRDRGKNKKGPGKKQNGTGEKTKWDRRKNKMGPEKKQNGTGEMRNCPCIGGGIEIRKIK